jgi:hypothetical protein
LVHEDDEVLLLDDGHVMIERKRMNDGVLLLCEEKDGKLKRGKCFPRLGEHLISQSSSKEGIQDDECSI